MADPGSVLVVKNRTVSSKGYVIIEKQVLSGGVKIVGEWVINLGYDVDLTTSRIPTNDVDLTEGSGS